MSVEDRLRAGLLTDARSLPEAQVERDLEGVLVRARWRTRRRWGGRLAAAGAVAAAAAVALGALRTPDRPPPEPAESVEALAGDYVVDVPASRAATRLGIDGRWVVRIAGDGTLTLDAPPGGLDGAADAALTLRDGLVVTNALHGAPGCQAGAGVGTYEWDRRAASLSFALVGEDCRARVVLLTSTNWERVP